MTIPEGADIQIVGGHYFEDLFDDVELLIQEVFVHPEVEQKRIDGRYFKVGAVDHLVDCFDNVVSDGVYYFDRQFVCADFRGFNVVVHSRIIMPPTEAGGVMINC